MKRTGPLSRSVDVILHGGENVMVVTKAVGMRLSMGNRERERERVARGEQGST